MDWDDPEDVYAHIAAGHVVWKVELFGSDEWLQADFEVGVATATVLEILGISVVPDGGIELTPSQLDAICPGLEVPSGGSAFVAIARGPMYTAPPSA